MRHISRTVAVEGTEYIVAPKIIAEVQAVLNRAMRQSLAREQDDDWIPIEKIFPDINHPIRGPANYLRGIRGREGLTQTQLAKKTGIKQSHISEMERYKRVIGKVTAKKLAAALNCNWRSMVSE